MNGRDGRLAVLAAVFAGARAPALLGRVSGPRAAEAVEDAGRLASSPRSERLRALATALSTDCSPGRAAAEAAAGHERAAVAAVLRAVGAGTTPVGASGALLRLCRERVGR